MSDTRVQLAIKFQFHVCECVHHIFSTFNNSSKRLTPLIFFAARTFVQIFGSSILWHKFFIQLQNMPYLGKIKKIQKKIPIRIDSTVRFLSISAIDMIFVFPMNHHRAKTDSSLARRM